MQTIVLATQKGGSGKSTLAIGLALAAKEAGHNVRLIEADQQGTLLPSDQWIAMRTDWPANCEMSAASFAGLARLPISPPPDRCRFPFTPRWDR